MLATFFPFFGLGFGVPLALYFLPSIIALARNKRDTLAIFSAEPVSRLERYRMVCGADMGRQT